MNIKKCLNLMDKDRFKHFFIKKANYSNLKTKQAKDYELIALAYHEASHAIIATFHFMKISSIRISNEKEMDGLTEWENFFHAEYIIQDLQLQKLMISNEIDVFYAGFVGEKIYYKDISGSERFPQTLKYGSENDIAKASNLIKKYSLALPGKDRSKLKKSIQSDISRLLIENWDAVKAVAHALYQRRKLNFDDLKLILTKKTKNKLLWKEKYKQIELLYEHKEKINESELKIIISK